IGFSSSGCTINATNTTNAFCLQARAKMWAGTYPFALILLDDQNVQYENLQLLGAPSKLILHDGGAKGGAISNESMNPGNGNIYSTPLTASGGTYYLCPGTYSGTLSESSPGSTVIMYPGVYRFTAPIAMSLSGGTIRNATAADYSPPVGAILINCTGYNVTAPAPADLGLIIEIKPPDCPTAGFNVSGGSTTLT